MLDLFGEVQVTLDDVELWIDSRPNHSAETAPFRREQYAKYYNLASIISDAKLSGDFYLIEAQHLAFTERRQVSIYQTVYAKTPAELQAIVDLGCPKTRHECNVKSCEWRIKQTRKKRNARYYAKKIVQLDRYYALINLKI